MTNYTVDNLTAITVLELREIAKGLEISLSYKDENGKRQRYTKPQLIEMIAATQEMDSIATAIANETSLVEKQANTITVVNEQNKPINATVALKEKQPEVLNLNTVVNDSRKLLAVGKVEKVKNWINKLLSDIAMERKNKLLVKQMSNKVNILKALIKSYSKGGSYAY